MKIEVRSMKADGLVSRFALVFENGLVLQAPSMLWSGKEDREVQRIQFDSVVGALKLAGFEIDDQR